MEVFDDGRVPVATGLTIGIVRPSIETRLGLLYVRVLAGASDDPDHHHDVAEMCLEVARSKGFELASWENLPAVTMFMVTELDEARTAGMEESRLRLEEELTDLAVRTMATLSSVWGRDWTPRCRVVSNREIEPSRFQPLECRLWPALGWLCRAARDWRGVGCIESERRDDVRICFEYALMETAELLDRLDAPMMPAALKMCGRNLKRPMLNGHVERLG